ncbi:MAG: NADH-ubiquinone oxidoreductase-F iron-sulfur binding region domain-containing protein [Verrucomicrobiota bacterium]
MPSTILSNYQAIVNKARQNLEERGEADKIVIQTGSATCENAAGASDVMAEFKKHIEAAERDDIILRQTGCTGRCSREPIVNIIFPDQKATKYQQVTPEMVHEIFTSHVLHGKPLQQYILDDISSIGSQYEFHFCAATACAKESKKDWREIFKQKLKAADIDEDKAGVFTANCFGLCRTPEEREEGAYILVRPGKSVYRVTSEADLDKIIEQHIRKDQIAEDLQVQQTAIAERFLEMYGDIAFFNQQSRIALRNSGIINPEDITEYINYDGFNALAQVLDSNDADSVIRAITDSKLRGRGGGGFPTGIKWQNTAKQEGDEKYIICNADEGDPGAFMDRSMLEGDPFSVIEGMTIGAFTVGANRGFFYVRAEYPLAIERINNALAQCRELGLLGDNILGSDFSFDIDIRLGAGAFVCGEETALLHSIEGARGQPRIRPPYPAESGLWGKPTVINNVETWANIPPILDYGSEWFSQLGSESSGGTKVFALAGKVHHTGLVEVPMGTTLREIVYSVGGGVADGKKVKAIQTGGPAGGCLPAEWLDTEVDFDSLMQAGSIMGSGGMIVMDEDDCMVDIAKFFITFSQSESCGKCTPCREGTTRMLEILQRITEGKGEDGDIERLERLANLVKKASLCGLGRAAPNPVLSTLKHFRDEYEAHVYDKHCPATRCTGLVRYEIDEEKCVGCTACARNCPVACISGEPKKVHEIDQSRCIKCGRCYEVCKFDAVKRL